MISLSISDLLVHSWTADYQRLQPVDLALVGDSRVALPALLDLLSAGGDAAADRSARADSLAAEGRVRRAAWAGARAARAAGALSLRFKDGEVDAEVRERQP